MKELSPETNVNPININIKTLNTKLSNEIIYLELELNLLNDLNSDLIQSKKVFERI